MSLTFDDAMRSQFELAVPMLAEAGLAGTFYVNPRGTEPEPWRARWREAALAGHEIGNHTVHHVCSRNFGFSAERYLEKISLDEMEWEIAEGKRRLAELIPERPEMSFCYPCYQDSIGAGSSRQSYVPLVAKHHPAARGRGEVPNHPLWCDLHALGSFAAERMSGAELVGLAERAASQGRWTILTFHGIQEGNLSVQASDFKELIEHLRRHRARIRTAPVIEIAAHIASVRGTLEEGST